MSWLYSRVLVEEYSAANCSDGAPSALSNSSPMPQAYLHSDKMTDFSKLSRFGMTFAPLTDDHGADLLTWYLADSRARTSAQQDEAPESTASDQDSGPNSLASFARYDRAMRSWKTPQCSLLEDSTEYSETWPRWGLMRDGVCWEQTPSVHLTRGIASGLWPTPVARDDGKTPEAHMRMKANMPGGPRKKPTSLQVMVKGIEQGMWQPPRREIPDGDSFFHTPNTNGIDGGSNSRAALKRRKASMQTWPTPTAINDSGGAAMCKWGGSGSRAKLRAMVTPQELNGALNPSWVEWLMGWPLDWTSLQPIAGDLHPWQSEPADVPRVSTGITARQHRLKAIGNGQVPQCAAAAWKILTGETDEP